MIYSLLSTLSDNHPLREEDDYHCEALTHHDLLKELKMLLSSRARYPGIEEIPLINTSVLNFGIDESFQQIDELLPRRNIMEHRLKTAIARFEPRLTQVSITSKQDKPDEIQFNVQANYLQKRLTIQLIWNDDTGVFYFDE
ncbi:GPW/gp25 family protein [Kosakonia oryzae]|uniref:GPW/gp25 family protein n=1 Tax=Kosakonia oryzae TaxID=497725 RepID=A0AA94KPR8_9ENTR|nr:GPW/gp25 family protein [Kosakonia oryzae]ANI82679.1 GPW/gp25 family protein [Kosakonia oryzae]SFC24539.1 type VI secretion system protein ImpF [Kosakonia oryzae]